MRARLFTIFLLGSSLALGAFLGPAAHGQRGGGPPGGGPGGPGGGPGGPGGPGGGPGGPMGPGRPPGGPGAGPERGPNSDAQRSAGPFGPARRWWDDKSAIKAVGLSKEQQKKMDSIFDTNKPAILAAYKTLMSRQDKLDKLNQNSNTDKEQLFAAIDAVNEARSALQKTTAAVLLDIRQEMNPEQIEKLEKLH